MLPPTTNEWVIIDRGGRERAHLSNYISLVIMVHVYITYIVL